MSNRTAKRTLPLLSMLTLLAPLQSASAAQASDDALIIVADIQGKPVEARSSTHFGPHLVGAAADATVNAQRCRFMGQPAVAMVVEGQSDAYLLDNNGKLISTISGASKTDATAIVVLDLGNDGKDDALVAWADGTIGLVKGLTAKHSNEITTVAYTGGPVIALVAGQGVAYAAVNSQGLPWAKDGAIIEFQVEHYFPILQGIKGLRGLTTADFDGDKIDELVVAMDGGIAVVSTDKLPADMSKAPLWWKGEPWAVAAGDTDGDGLAELVVSEKHGADGSIYVIRKIGKVSVTFGSALGVGASLAVVDLNGDGFGEICAGVANESMMVCVTPDAFEGYVMLDNTDDEFLREHSALIIVDMPGFGAVLSVGDVDGAGLLDLLPYSGQW